MKYLYDEYGDGKVPLSLSMGPLTTISASVGQLPRVGKVCRRDFTASVRRHVAHLLAVPSRDAWHFSTQGAVLPRQPWERVITALNGMCPSRRTQSIPDTDAPVDSVKSLRCVKQGMNYRPSKKPEKPITIWAYEASPFCMQTRERLTELEIPHLYKNCARNSMKRDEITEKWGACSPALLCTVTLLLYPGICNRLRQLSCVLQRRQCFSRVPCGF